LALVGILDPRKRAKDFPKAFSDGERQRIGIAGALIVRPKFIIADEAASALDVFIQAEIVNLMQYLRKEFGLTYLFIGHDLALVRRVSDDIALMYRARCPRRCQLWMRFFHPLPDCRREMRFDTSQPSADSVRLTSRLPSGAAARISCPDEILDLIR